MVMSNLRKALDPAHPDEDENSESARLSRVKVLLQRTEVEETNYTKPYRNSLPEVYCTTASILDGKLELFLVRGKIACALYHYQVDHPVTIPIGLISSAPEVVSTAERILDDLTLPPARVRAITRGIADIQATFRKEEPLSQADTQ
jgi:hypothetical protein